MKKVLFLLLFLLNTLNIISADLAGLVRVENLESYGVFVYVEETMQYDISDELGKFKLTGFEAGKEYTLVFQKENMEDIKKIVKINKDKEFREFFIKKETEIPKYDIKLLVSSPIKKDAYLKIDNFPYGILANANEYTYSKLEEGSYTAKVIQDGAESKKIKFEVKARKMNNLGIISLKAKEANNLRLNIADQPEDGYLFLYKNNELKYFEKIKENRSYYDIKNMESGKYDILIKSYGKKDYEDSFYLKGVKNLKIDLEDLSETNMLYLNLYPEDQLVNIKLYDEDGILIKEEKNAQGNNIFYNLDWDKSYTAELNSKGYKTLTLKDLKVGEKVSAAMAKDIKGVRIEGNIYPFDSMAEVMLIDSNKIIAKTTCDEKGHYVLESDEFNSGRKTIKVRAKGFAEYKEIRTLYKEQEIQNLNLSIKPLTTTFFGRVSLEDSYDIIEGVIVSIEELGMWQYANKNGRYYFSNIPWGVYTLTYKKAGYSKVLKKVYIKENELKEINIELEPQTHLYIKANVKDYKISINGEQKISGKHLYVKSLKIDKYDIYIQKKGYIDVKRKVKFQGAGEVKELIIVMKKLEDYKKSVQEKLKGIGLLIKDGEIKEAEEELSILYRDENAYIVKPDLDKVKFKIKELKEDVFDFDKKVRIKIKETRKSLLELENSKLAYGKKRKKLDSKYKESIEYFEKVLKEKKYTQIKYEIYSFISEIYFKLGMENSGEQNKKIAEKYKN
jgi:hypothetical protein